MSIADDNVSIRRSEPVTSHDNGSQNGRGRVLSNDGHEPGEVEEVFAPRVSVIIPTLNEAENLPYILPHLPEIHELILVDGLSTDGTVEVAQRLYPDCRVVHQTRRGKGNALSCGLEAATGDIVVLLDADGSANPHEIPRFVEALLAGADYAKGSRFLPGGGSLDITLLRRAGNWALTGLVNTLFRTSYTDLCYGFNACWLSCFRSISLNGDGFEVETMINIRIAKAKLRVVEVPSLEQARIHGVSNLSTFRDGWRVLRTILLERLRPLDGLVPALDEHLVEQVQAAR